MIKKVLIKKQRSEKIEERRKPIIFDEGKTYFVEDITKDFHSSDGLIKAEDLQKENTTITSNKGKEFVIFNANFMDSYKGIKKLAQTIPLKDIGFIIAETGLTKESIVVDTGSGSGGSACFIAKHVKHVYTYDVEQKNIDQTQKNVSYFELTNVTVEKANVYEEIPVRNVDLILLDLPETCRAIESADSSLKIGGYIVSYCPQITQSQQFVNAIIEKGNYIIVKSVEVIERDWKIEGQIVRPRSLSNIHSGFITIVRKIN